MDIIIITTCTNRKTLPVYDRIQGRELKTGSQARVTDQWKTLVKRHPVRVLAKELYCGRGFGEAVAASQTAEADLWIVSAGLGLVDADEEVPAYDLTLSPGSPNTIRDKVTTEVFSPSEWWSDLARRRRPKRSLAWLVRENPSATVVIAVPFSYLLMIEDDLLSLNALDLGRIRLIGPLNRDSMDERLQTVHMPYDDRLNGKGTPIAGTRADFPQRALRRFVEKVCSQALYGNATAHAQQVEDLLSGLAPPSVPKRQQYSDDDLIELILRCWDRAEGKAGRMLRVLRDEDLVACEQGRLSRLFKRAQERREEQEADVGSLSLRAVRTSQGNGIDVYSFFLILTVFVDT